MKTEADVLGSPAPGHSGSGISYYKAFYQCARRANLASQYKALETLAAEDDGAPCGAACLDRGSPSPVKYSFKLKGRTTFPWPGWDTDGAATGFVSAVWLLSPGNAVCLTPPESSMPYVSESELVVDEIYEILVDSGTWHLGKLLGYDISRNPASARFEPPPGVKASSPTEASIIVTVQR